MKNKIGTLLVFIGILFTFGGPIYQAIDMKVKNIEGDGLETYGDNFMFRDVLGMKKVHYDLEPGYGWEQYGTTIHTTKWMQSIGMPETVSRYWDWEETTTSDHFWTVVMLRWIVKLIPILLIILGIGLATNSRSFFYSGGIGSLLTGLYFPCSVMKIL